MHTIQLSDNDIAVVFDGLGELKLKFAGPVFTSIQTQLMAAQVPAGGPDREQVDGQAG